MRALDIRMRRLKILIVDDFELFRRSICFLLKQRPEFDVVGEASDGLQALQKATEFKPDLVLLDATLPKMRGIDTARALRTLLPESQIIFMNYESNAHLVQQTLSMGISGYLVKTSADKDLLNAVDAVARGERYCSPDLADRVRRDVNSKPFFHFELDPENRIFLARFNGPVSSESINEFYHAAAAAALLAREFRGSIADFSGVSRIRVMPHTIRELAALPPADPVATRPRIVVAPNAGLFALARLFQTVGRKTRPNLRLARNLDDAFTQLGVTAPRFDPIFPWAFGEAVEPDRLADSACKT